MKLIGQAHTMLHEKGVVRIQTDIRVGSRYFMWYGVLRRTKSAKDLGLGPIKSSRLRIK